MKQIEIVFFDAGGGHRSAASALQEVCAAQGRPWEVNLLNLQEQLDQLDITLRLTGVRMQDVYNLMLKKGWTLGSTQIMHVLQSVIRLYHKQTVRLLEPVWNETHPDMVISVVPHFNRALFDSLRNTSPKTLFVTLLTDLAEYPPHFWIENQLQYFICGTEHAAAQALEIGNDPRRIFRASGMILQPRFYDPIPINREAERERLGLDPALPTGIVLFGGQGSKAILEIAERLDASPLNLQLILICGKNEKLASRLRMKNFRFPVHVEGFTRRVASFMHIADFFVGKPGPGSISEALAMHLPVIAECNSWTLPQERFNARWVREKEVGLVVKNFQEIAAAAAELLHPENFRKFRANAAAMNNRAVFEIPDILEGILENVALTAGSSVSAGGSSNRR
jgi:UDP-N-acetylglucosamine:LPS N-acetylglucosamine transferase